MNTNQNHQQTVPLKAKNERRRNKCDLGEHFIAPDGGWGWIVCIAAGLSNLFVNAVILTFGLIFREKLAIMGFSSSEMTTIFNSQQAIASCTGLLNGAMFRRFSYRQIGLSSAIVVGMSIFLTAIADSFLKFILLFSIAYGSSLGINMSATALALNTYFKERRRRAASFAWTLTGLGPFFMPYLITILLPYYGVQGTLLILGAFSLNAVACALLYQPVKWHVKKPIELEKPAVEKKLEFCITEPQWTNAEEENEGVINVDYGILHSGTPMLSRVNDGWYGSKLSLTSIGLHSSSVLNVSRSCKDLENGYRREFKKSASNLGLKTNTFTGLNNTQIVPLVNGKTTISKNDSCDDNNNNSNQFKWYQKIAIFFDLDLLKDCTYVNLLFGITLASFSDMNFSTLTPFFLSEFGFSPQQIALLMSLIGGADIIVRFIVPFVIEKCNWDNRVFFLIALVGMIFGRVVISQQPTFTIAVVTFIWMGLFKGLRTIFMCLIIPDHVELKRLPAASGLQLITAGIFTLLFGPIVGTIRDVSDYTWTLHFLNLISFTTVISWSIELTFRSYQKHKKKPQHHNCEALDT